MLESFVTKKRDTAASLKFLKKAITLARGKKASARRSDRLHSRPNLLKTSLRHLRRTCDLIVLRHGVAAV